jgi:tetratricopeptide (TPR) repeat protein
LRPYEAEGYRLELHDLEARASPEATALMSQAAKYRFEPPRGQGGRGDATICQVASEEADGMTPYVPFARGVTGASRRRQASLFIPTLLAIAACAALLATVPWERVHVHVPGQRHLQAVLDRVPQPWKPPRPQYVPLPDPPAAPAASRAPAASEAGAAPAAPAQPTVAATAATSPASPPPAQASAVTIASAPPAFRLEGFRHQWQTWNNCGPATITMATSHFGRPELQAQAAQFLKPNANDKNVGPDELVAYTRSVGLSADWRVNGDLNRLKQLIANGVPVVVETWFTPHPNDGMGHYRLLVGYDDAAGRFYAYDSYEPPGQNVPLPYGAFDADWRVFNRTYIPVYPGDKADLVNTIVGDDVDPQVMWTRALQRAQAEIASQPNDAFAWFDAGTDFVALGRMAEAAQAFDRARALKLPWRMLWYQFAPFEAYLAQGRYNDVLTLANANLAQANDLEESHYYRGRALEALGQAAAARAAYQTAIKLNPHFLPAYDALSRLG